jgi:uncharacterized protein (TIGR03067 family)
LEVPTREEISMSDQENIQGIWQLNTGERGGKPFPDDVVKGVLFDGDKLTTKVKDRATTFAFKLFPDQMPKAIDLDMDGTIGQGIYRLEGNTLTIVHTEAGQDRPSEFATKDGTPLTMMVLKRQTQ